MAATTDDSPPVYQARLSFPPGYLDDKPSISLTGVLPTAWGDVSSPPTGRGVVVSDLLDVNARRRFAAFGRTFADRERRRQAHKAIRAEAKAKVDVERQPGGPEPEENCSCDYCSGTRIFVRFYKLHLM